MGLLQITRRYTCENPQVISRVFRYKGKPTTFFETVPCGRCVVCKSVQSKMLQMSAETELFHNSKSFVFATLTYAAPYCPYASPVSSEELSEHILDMLDSENGDLMKKYGDEIEIWKIRRAAQVESETSTIENKYVVFNKAELRKDLPVIHKAQNRNNACKVSGGFHVLYYDDIQRFLKRIRKAYWKETGHTMEMVYILAREYGAQTLRPHYHILFALSGVHHTEAAGWLRENVCKHWSYADKRLTRDNTVIADINAASYVQGYLTAVLHLPATLAFTRGIQSRVSHSVRRVRLSDYGLTMATVAKAVESGDYVANCKRSPKDGVARQPIPSCVLRRIFKPCSDYANASGFRLRYLATLFSSIERRTGLPYKLGYQLESGKTRIVESQYQQAANLKELLENTFRHMSHKKLHNWQREDYFLNSGDYQFAKAAYEFQKKTGLGAIDYIRLTEKTYHHLIHSSFVEEANLYANDDDTTFAARMSGNLWTQYTSQFSDRKNKLFPHYKGISGAVKDTIAYDYSYLVGGFDNVRDVADYANSLAVPAIVEETYKKLIIEQLQSNKTRKYKDYQFNSQFN